MDGHIKVGGSWKRISNIHTKVGGSWKAVNAAYIRVGGSWKQFFARALLDAGNGGTVSATDGTGSPYDTNVGIRFNADGSVETGTSINSSPISWVSAGSWIDPESASSDFNCSVRYTNRVSAGGHDFTAKAANEDSWIALTSTRTWVWNRTTLLASGNNNFDCDFEVKDDGGSLATATRAWTFQIENSA